VSNIDVTLDLGDVGAFSVVSCRVAEGISELTLAQIEIASREDLDFSELLHRDAVVTMLLDGFEVRRWTLKVGEVAFLRVEGGSLRYRVDLHPQLWLLQHTVATRKFRKVTPKQIITTVLAEHGVKHQWKLTREPDERNYCVQYRETALAFISRLLEFEGIYYTFDDDGVLVLADKSSAARNIEGQAYLELIDSAGALARAEFGVHEIRRGAEIVSGAATVNDFDWKKSKVKLIATQKGPRDADLETYDYPVGYRDEGEGHLLARLRYESQQVPAKYVEGLSNVPGFAPARLFEFGSAAGAAFAGEHLLLHIVHTAHNQAFLAHEHKEELYENEFHAIPRDVPFRPAVVTPRPTVEGCHTAMVRGPTGEEIHTDQFGRFKAQFHWDREAKETDEDSRWVRMLQETATSMTLARVGWEMHVAYIDGDPDRPVGIARNINGEMVPTYNQPALKTVMTLKTLTYPGGGGYNEMRLDDIAGAMRFDVKAERDLVGVVKNDKSETIGQNQTHVIDAMLAHTVERDQTRSVGGNDTTKVLGPWQFHVTKNRKMSVGGSEKITADTSSIEAVTGNDTENVGAARITLSSGASISRVVEAGFTRMVGGGYAAKAEGAIQHQAGKELTETIGGTKLTVSSEGNILQTVAGFLTINVGGAVMKTAKGDLSVSAKKTKVNVGADAAIKSGIRVEMRSEVIHLEATSKMTLKVGGLVFEFGPDKTTITGPLKLKSDNTIRVTGNPDHLTK
jgi:type VI secretion system secreted protein VgrG